MNGSHELYVELRSDIEALAGALFEVTEGEVRKRSAFLPHGAVLAASGEVSLVAAAPPEFEERAVSDIEVLPLLHEALRSAARERDIRVVAVCEDVTITPENGPSSAAIKVLIEHRRGLSLALYLPHHPIRNGEREFGQIFVTEAPPEVKPWAD